MSDRDGARYGLEVYEVPESMGRIAHERTEGLVSYALRYTAGYRALPELAASAYMQGVLDAVDSQILKQRKINRTGIEIEGAKP